MALPTGPLEIAVGDTFSSNANQQHPLGTYAETSDGRGWRYCQAGAVDLVAGNWIQASAQIANHLAMTPSAAAIGVRAVTVTPGATAGAANLYAEGFAIVSTTPDIGSCYQVKDHLAITASVAFVVNIKEPAGLAVAWTSSTRVDLQANPYKNVIQTPVTTLTGSCVGVAQAIITATQFGWLLVHGPGACLIAGTPSVGLAVVVPGTAAGACVVDGAASATPVVGTMMTTGVDGKCNAVFVTLL